MSNAYGSRGVEKTERNVYFELFFLSVRSWVLDETVPLVGQKDFMGSSVVFMFEKSHSKSHSIRRYPFLGVSVDSETKIKEFTRPFRHILIGCLTFRATTQWNVQVRFSIESLKWFDSTPKEKSINLIVSIFISISLLKFLLNSTSLSSNHRPAKAHSEIPSS